MIVCLSTVQGHAGRLHMLCRLHAWVSSRALHYNGTRRPSLPYNNLASQKYANENLKICKENPQICMQEIEKYAKNMQKYSKYMYAPQKTKKIKCFIEQ